MMFVISPLLALIALVTIPLSMFVTKVDRASGRRGSSSRSGGTPARSTGTSRRRSPGTSWSRCSGGSARSSRPSPSTTTQLFEASFGAQFVSGLIMPAMMFIGNLNYVAVAVVGGLRVASGSMSLGDVQAFIQYSRQFTQPLTQVASMANLLQSGVASAERVFDLLDAAGADARPGDAGPTDRARAAGSSSSTSSFRYEPDVPLIDDLSLVAEPGHTVAIVGPTGAGKTTLVNLVMRFYELDGGRITLDGVDIAAHAARRAARRDRHGAAGHLAVRRHDPRQHRVRQARRRPRTRSSTAAAGHATSTGSCSQPARRLRHGDRRGGRATCQRRREAADHHRAGVPRRAVAADPGRGDQRRSTPAPSCWCSTRWRRCGRTAPAS